MISASEWFERQRRFDPAIIQLDDLIAEHGHISRIVRDQHHWDLESRLQLGKLAPHSFAHGGIECGKWLVQQQHARLRNQRARKRNTLLLPPESCHG